ncbi:hypothetical protein L195_g061788, partial [Trifolium pratense]
MLQLEIWEGGRWLLGALALSTFAADEDAWVYRLDSG